MMSMSMRMLRVGGPRWCSGALSLARAASTGTGGGFSYPGPRALGQIVKLELMQSEEREQIQHIWEQFHADKDDAVAATLSSDVFQTLQARATAAPFFVFPVYRQDGFFNMLCQFQQTCFLVTYLEAFKENPTGAPPCLAVSLYDELLENKEVGLVRGDVINMLDKRESQALLDQLLASYSDERLYEHVDKFNNQPEQFDFEGYRALLQDVVPPSPSPSPSA